MSKDRTVPESTATVQKRVVEGRVVKLGFKNMPAVDARMWAQMQAAARKADKKRRYPVLLEAPDA